MKSRKKGRKKFNFTKLLCFILILLVIVFGIYKIVNREDNSIIEDNKVLMIDITNMNIQEVEDKLGKYKLDIDITYEYNDEIEKNNVISQSIEKDKEIKEGDKLSVVVSLGKLDKEKLKSDGINELGKVPIMMYHGIKNMRNSDTSNTGGNVDKDGYTRTVEAFRNDLEMYYTSGYRMIKLSDYIEGKIDVEYGYSPIILTFDDGNDNNILDPNSAVGVLEEYKKKYPDFNVTAIFFVTVALFNQPEYNEKILKWLIDNGYEVGNHTKGHNNLSNTSTSETQEVVGYVYNQLEGILGNKYSKIVALPFGSPYLKSHTNYPYVLTSPFGWRGGEYHDGLDISGTGFGSPIYAISGGVVRASGYGGMVGNSAGLNVVIEHPNGYWSIYAHLSATYVNVGDTVSRKQKIAAMGHTGRASGTHLHLGISIGQPYASGSRLIPPLTLWR